jgi:hypothetical protein
MGPFPDTTGMLNKPGVLPAGRERGLGRHAARTQPDGRRTQAERRRRSAAAPTFAAVVLASVIDTAPALVTVSE